ncbi:MAG: transglutaminase domain-containing protein [bacterium]|nr:transglutaminase domain-containing protein [bacterium]
MRKKITVLIVLLMCLLSACSSPDRLTSKHYINTGEDQLNETTRNPSSAPENSDSSVQTVTSEHSVSHSSGPTDDHTSESSQPAKDNTYNLSYNGYYYKNLTVGQKSIYKKIDAAIYEMKNGYIDLGSTQYSNIILAYAAVINDRSEYFWLDQSKYGIKYEDGKYYMCFSGVNINDLQLSYLYSEDQKSLLQQQIDQRLRQIILEAQAKENEYEKALLVHDWVVKNIEYDSVTADAVINKNQAGLDKDSFTILGGVLPRQTNHGVAVRAVCEGYAKTYHYILKQLGFESVLVTGNYNGYGHMWNCVKINNEWYFTDCTNDDLYSEAVSHTFFNVSSRALSRVYNFDKTVTPYTVDTITEDESFNFCLPECKSTQYNYFVVNKRCLSLGDFNIELGMVEASANTISKIADLIVSENAKQVKTTELCFGDATEFVFNEDTTAALIGITDIAEQIKKTGAQIKNIRVKGINGAKGFMICWE